MRISDCSVRGHIFEQIGDGVALGLEGCGRPRDTGGRLRINTGCMIDKVGIEAALADLFRRKITGELIKNAGDHLHVRKFFGTNIGKDSLAFLIWHGVALVEVAHRGAELTVRPAKLRNDDFCELRIRVFDFYRELQAFII